MMPAMNAVPSSSSRHSSLLDRQQKRLDRRLTMKPGYFGALFCLGSAVLACSSGGEDTGGSGGMSGAGSGGSSGSGGSGSDPSQLPSDTTATGIASFIQAGTYKSWVHDAAPRPAFSLLTHGNNMQVYFNELAV